MQQLLFILCHTPAHPKSFVASMGFAVHTEKGSMMSLCHQSGQISLTVGK